MKISEIPKIELHCHLDGSVDAHTLLTNNEEKTVSESQLISLITAPNPCNSLMDYLSCFKKGEPYLQTMLSLEKAAYNVISQSKKENVIYTEVRFAPLLHLKKGLEISEVIQAVVKGLEAGEKDFGVKSRAILSMLRGEDYEKNINVVNEARSFRDYGVCGLDLAGNEAAYPPELHADLFDLAVKWDIPFTIHAGETGNPENVRRSVQMGAKRIGHGLAIAGHEDITGFLLSQDVCLEMCPTSNLQTKAINGIERYPFIDFQNVGLSATINTDNRTVSNTTLTREWELLKAHEESIDEALIIKTNKLALQYAFLPYGEKKRIEETLDNLIKKQ